ncbi:MAG: NifS protein [Cyanobacteriota bacterium]
MSYPIYLDNHATTAIDRRVFDAMRPYFETAYGNAGSVHAYGWQVEAAIKQARQAIADGLGIIESENIIFTSGATEANNLAIKGVAEAHFHQGKHLITAQTEHSAVLAPCRYLESLGFEVTYLPVQTNGLINLQQFEQVLRPDTILVSIMAANNEIGVLQPLGEIGERCRERQIIFHTDAAQAIAKIPLDVAASKIDLLSFTAHKIHGPKGIGGLYRRSGIAIAPQLHGGGQEGGLRSGTLPPPLIVGMAKAVTLGLQTRETESDRLLTLRTHLWQNLAKIGGVILNGDWDQRLPGNLNVSFAGVKGQSLLLALQPHLAVSAGSACASQTASASHVLQALGRDQTLAQASLRFGLSRFTTAEEIDAAIAIVTQIVNKLRH